MRSLTRPSRKSGRAQTSNSRRLVCGRVIRLVGRGGVVRGIGGSSIVQGVIREVRLRL